MQMNRQNCESFLICVIGQMVRAGVTTAAALLADEPLKALLFQALTVWSTHIACAQHTVVEISRFVGMTREEMVSDFVSHVFNQGKRDGSVYPCLTRLLDVAHRDGAQAAIPYLMRAARYRALDLERRYEVRQERSGEMLGFDGEDEYGVIDPGESRDGSLADMDETIAARQAMEAFISRIGQDFVGDVVILSDALGLKRSLVSQFFFSGRQVELVIALVRRFNAWMHHDYTSSFAPLMAQARKWVLPERFRRDPGALLKHLYRKSSSAARARMAERTGLLAS